MPYPEETRPSLFGIDAVNARGYEYPLVDENDNPVTQTLSNQIGSTRWVITPRGVHDLFLIVEVTGTVGCRVDVTSSRVDEVLAGTAFSFSLGNITASTKYEIKPCTAVRLHQASGTGSCKLHYRAQ
jgi:hypothetical protein